MKNGHLETWQVVRWLSKHPTHAADAPDTAMKYPARVRVGVKYLVFETRFDGVWETDNAPDLRDDWTIRNERGRKVRFKKKARIVDTGVPVNREDLIRVCSRNGDHVFARIVVTGKGGTILIRERKA